MAEKEFKMEKCLNILLSIIIFLVIVLVLYYLFLGLGVGQGDAMVESLVMASAIITPVLLYLFGKTWKKEIKQ